MEIEQKILLKDAELMCIYNIGDLILLCTGSQYLNNNNSFGPKIFITLSGEQIGKIWNMTSINIDANYLTKYTTSIIDMGDISGKYLGKIDGI